MNEIRYSNVSTEELIRRFIAGARRVGMWAEVPDGLAPRDPKAPAVREEVRAIARELKARNDLAALRQLYDHPSNNVRDWACGQFVSIDPEWATAGPAGAAEGLTATEVMTYRARALQKPPRRPTVKEMTTDQLAARFEDACIRDYATRFFSDKNGGPDIEFGNRIIGEIINLWNELSARNALAVLLPFLDHENSMVRCTAAVYCLPIAAERALSILEGFKEKKRFSPEWMSALSALDHWHDKQKSKAG